MPTVKPTPPTPPNERSCYCHSVDEEFRRIHKLPDGFCGTCDRCGGPGHMRHFPGPLPYTGAWCDRCHRIVAWTWPFRVPTVWIAIIALAAILYPFLKRLFQ